MRIFVVSGGNCASGELLARTALAQFGETEMTVTVVPKVREVEELAQVVDALVNGEGFIIHTLVDSRLRQELITMARAHGVTAFDMMGPVLDQMASLLGSAPLGNPGLYRKLHEDYFKRVEAIEFAVGHDDGRGIRNLEEADIVLIGVSRAGKTPLSMYLAMEGYKTANIPLVNGISAPEAIFAMDRRKVIGLSLEPERLAAYRRRRQRTLGVGTDMSYADSKEIFCDLEHARAVFRRGRFTVVDVTNKPIEESASEVLTAVSRAALEYSES